MVGRSTRCSCRKPSFCSAPERPEPSSLERVWVIHCFRHWDGGAGVPRDRARAGSRPDQTCWCQQPPRPVRSPNPRRCINPPQRKMGCFVFLFEQARLIPGTVTICCQACAGPGCTCSFCSQDPNSLQYVPTLMFPALLLPPFSATPSASGLELT